MSKEKTYLSAEDEAAVEFFLRGHDYGWEERTAPKKRVILTNPEALEELSVMAFVKAFGATGHVEWEVLLASWLLNASGKAIAEKEECDITDVFNTTFTASRNRKFTKEQVYKHIIDFFTIEEETENTLKLSLNTGEP